MNKKIIIRIDSTVKIMDIVSNKPLTKETLNNLIETVKNAQYKQPYWVTVKTKDEDKYLLMNNYNSPYPISEIRRILYD